MTDHDDERGNGSDGPTRRTPGGGRTGDVDPAADDADSGVDDAATAGVAGEKTGGKVHGGSTDDGIAVDDEQSGGLSRRRFLRASAAAGVSALAVGAGTGHASAAITRENCGSGASFSVGNGTGEVINNDWSVSAGSNVLEQCIQKYDDGSYGWSWDRDSTGACPDDCPNYPEVLIGTKPWSGQTRTDLFPLQWGDVQDLQIDIDVDIDASDGEWNLALEWWFTESEPPGPNPTHEVMVLLDYTDAHITSPDIETGAFTDQYGNVFDYWSNPTHTDWTFHIFKIQGADTPQTVDLTPVVDYVRDVIDDPSLTPDHWVTGIEIGNEIWDNTSGTTRIYDLDVMLNGRVATTGVDDEFTSEPPAPAAPDADWTVTPDTTSVDIAWSAVEGATGYRVYRDGTQVADVDGTQTTITGLSPETAYTIGLEAYNETGPSERVTQTVTTVADGPPALDGTTPQDTDADGHYEDFTGNGEVDNQDVVVYFQNMGDGGYLQQNRQYFDYTGNGDIDYQDLISLFGQIA